MLFGTQLTGHLHPVPARSGRAGRALGTTRQPGPLETQPQYGTRCKDSTDAPTSAGPSGVKAEPYLQGCSDLLAHPQVTEFTESSQESGRAKESCESNSHRQLFFLTEIQPEALKQQAHIRKCVKKESHDSDVWNSNEAPSEWKGGGDRGLRWQLRAGV